ncbi:MAG: NAD-dependent succinate-semialdehyde dehydrogenase [Bacteroidota bacterium]|nr:NAD-dependent succinate-semialdehyde dehydrogenase [Bacteroidota bacterium]
MPLVSRNPTDGALIQVFEPWDTADIVATLERSVRAFREWRETPFEQRAASMRRLASLLREGREEHAVLMAREMGKPVTQGLAEADKCAWVCEYYADHAQRFLAPEHAESDGRTAYVRFDPLGPLLAVMPWNFPFWQVFRCAVPAVMAGNTVLLKHASNVTLCALRIEELFRAAGFPEDVFRTLVIESAHVEAVIAYPAVAAVTLTGSGPAGRAVARTAGEALKKTVLELGGSDPFIVLDDADTEAAAKTAAVARCINSGQSCIAAKRFIVTPGAADTFLPLFFEAMQTLRLGDPMDPATDIGPLAREDLLEELDAQVRNTLAQGASLLLCGHRLPARGFFYSPAVLDGVRPGMPAYAEELFGPVASVIRAGDEDEAVAIANDTPFGLGASVWTRDAVRGEAMAARIEAGSVFVNGMVKSDPRLPFGGVKMSGYGRELGAFGIREFVNIKTVWVA